jgi:hypothetical protein
MNAEPISNSNKQAEATPSLRINTAAIKLLVRLCISTDKFQYGEQNEMNDEQTAYLDPLY